MPEQPNADEQLRTALEAQRMAWIDRGVDEETRQQRIEQTTSQIQDLMAGRLVPALPQSNESEVSQSPEEQLQVLIAEQIAARRRGDKAALREITTKMIDLKAEIDQARPPGTE